MLKPSLLDNVLPANSGKIAVGISGGADSFTLLHLTMQWAAKKGIPLVALTVDHQLRPESAAEAQLVADWCHEHGIEHHTLPWTGEKPQTGLQDTARNVRRQLMCTFCKQNNIAILLQGHQADDQAETIIMRLQRGSGLHGLTGIPENTTDKVTGVTILRPLLHERREALRQYAQDQNLPFIDDPSNENSNFERARVRKSLSSLPQLADGIARAVARLNRVDKALDQQAAQWWQTHAQSLEGARWFPMADFSGLSDEVQLRVLTRAFQPANDYLPLEGLEKLLDSLKQEDFAGQTLAGLWLHPKVVDKTPGLMLRLAPPRKA